MTMFLLIGCSTHNTPQISTPVSFPIETESSDVIVSESGEEIDEEDNNTI